MQARRRGRPLGSTKHRESNAIIGQICETFSAWGYKIDGTICEAIAEAAYSCMERSESNGRRLRAGSIEKIHKTYVSQQRLVGHHPFRRWQYTKRELLNERPAWALDPLAAAKMLIQKPELRLGPPWKMPEKRFWIRRSRKPSRYRIEAVQVSEQG